MRQRPIAVALVGALLLVAGCIGGGGTATPTDRDTPTPDASPAEQLRYQAVTEMEGFETAEYELTTEVSTDQRAATISIDGVVDRTARKQYMNVTVEGSGAASTDSETYVDGTTIYQRTMGGWRTQDISDRHVWNNTQVGQSRAMLQAVSVSRAGNATVDGTRVRVLELEAEDMDAFREAVDRRLSRTGQSSTDGEITSFSAKAYVDPDTGYLLRMETDMSMRADGSTAQMSTTVTYSNINKPVSIEIPEAATGDDQQADLSRTGAVSDYRGD